MTNVVVLVRYNIYNGDLDSFTTIENKKLTSLKELHDVKSEGYHTFFRFFKRSLLDALKEEHRVTEVKIMVGHEVSVFHLFEGKAPFMKKGDDLLTSYPFKHNNHMIKAVIKEFCEKYSVVER